MLYPNFVEIFKKTNAFAKEIVVFTNLTKDCAKALIQILRNLKSKLIIITSIDGLQSHSINRPISNIGEIIKNIKLIHSKNKNVKIVINTVVTKYNINEVPQLIPIFKEIDIDKWRLDFPLKTKNLEIMPRPEQFIHLIKILIKERYKDKEFKKINLEIFKVYKSQIEKLSLKDIEKSKDLSLHPCAYFFGTIAIKANGCITLCAPLEYCLGNIFIKKSNAINLKKSLNQILKNKFFSMKIKDMKGCLKCRYVYLCAGGCRADAYDWFKNIRAKDPISCLLMPLIEKEIIPIFPKKIQKIYEDAIMKNRKNPTIPIFIRSIFMNKK